MTTNVRCHQLTDFFTMRPGVTAAPLAPGHIPRTRWATMRHIQLGGSA
jgi:hypothetical protein